MFSVVIYTLSASGEMTVIAYEHTSSFRRALELETLYTGKNVSAYISEVG